MKTVATALGIAAAAMLSVAGPASAKTVNLGNLTSGNALTMPTMTLVQGRNYYFTFDLLPNDNVLSQMQASFLTKLGSTPEPIQFSLYSGKPNPGGSLIATSSYTTGATLDRYLSSGLYYIKIDQIAVNDETGSGAVTAAGVPEPASWAMLIAGFGMAGYALRRRRIIGLA